MLCFQNCICQYLPVLNLISGGFFCFPYFGREHILGQLVAACGSPSCGSPACGRPSYAGQPALGGRIHQQPRQTIRPDETLSSAAPTLRCPRWNIIIVRVKNDPGATGAWWNYCHRSKPPIRVWPLIFRSHFSQILLRDFASWSPAREECSVDIICQICQICNFCRDGVDSICRQLCLQKNSMEPLSFATWKALMLQMA